MSDFGTMRTRIEGEIARSGVLTSQINNAINSAIAKYERRPTYFNIDDTLTFSTVANQEYYDSTDLTEIPDIVKIFSMRVQISDTWRRVDERPYALLDRRNSNSDYTGPPKLYARLGQRIRFSPIPDAARTVQLAAQVKYAALSDDTDTNNWMTEGEEVIRQAAKRDLYANTIRDYEAAAVAKTEEEGAWLDIRRETGRRLAAGLYTDMPMQGVFNITEGAVL